MDYKIAQDVETVLELTGITLSELAEETQISRATYNNWIKGRTNPGDANIAAFYEYAFNKGVRLNRIKEQLYREDLSGSRRKVLFHGSKTQIAGRINLDYSKNQNDFGAGFYCGESMEQSAMFVSAYPASSLYILSFDPKGLEKYTFGIERDWMLMVAYFRRQLTGYEDAAVVRKILKKIEGKDYIIAPIADNRMFEIIDQFIDGEITDVQCRHCLSATGLGNQYVFRTEAAIRNIELLEKCYLSQTEKESYLSSRQEEFSEGRDKVKMTRRKYRNQGDYIEDILK